jgi:hypothetical protein
MIGIDLCVLPYRTFIGKSDISIGINTADVRAFAIVIMNCVRDQ